MTPRLCPRCCRACRDTWRYCPECGRELLAPVISRTPSRDIAMSVFLEEYERQKDRLPFVDGPDPVDD